METAQGSCAAEVLPVEVRGTGFGTLAAINGVGDTIASIIVGWLWIALTPAVGFGFGTVFALLGLLLPPLMRKPYAPGGSELPVHL